MVWYGTVSTPYWGRNLRYGTNIWVVLLLPNGDLVNVMITLKARKAVHLIVCQGGGSA